MGSMQVHIVDATERLDAASVTDFKEMAKNIIKHEDSLVIIDFFHTKFIDSAGLGALVSILKSASQHSNVKVALVSLSPQISQIFELTKLYRLFDIYANIDEAEDALG